MIGLSAVKKTVEALVRTLQFNCRRELDEQPPVEYTLNRDFLGNPGTGKTSVAKIYGQVLVDIGLLSSSEGRQNWLILGVILLTSPAGVVKNPSDFVDSMIGGSEKNTRGILTATLGKILVIYEAYGLFAGGNI